MDIAVEPRNGTVPSLRFFRSMRLDTDIRDPDLLAGYSVTPHVRDVLRRVLAGLSRTERACTLTGPYGGGKTAFAVFVGQLLSSVSNGAALKLLSEVDSTLALSIREMFPNKGLLPVAVTARRAPLERCLLEGMRATLDLLPTSAATAALESSINDLLDGPERIDTREVIKAIQALRELSCKAGHAGLLLIVDELGKSLEYCSMTQGGDVYLLQELAEICNRSNDQPMLLIGILHQPFERYGEMLDFSGQREWAKVQGRFCDLAFLEPAEEQIRLAAEAAHSLAVRHQSSWDLGRIASAMVETGHCPPGLPPEEFVRLSQFAYPLHPTVLAALPHVFRRLAQNERSLYAFLGSGEPYSVRSLMNRDDSTLVRLSDLFDYLVVNMGSRLRQQLSTRRRWIEVMDALESRPGLSPVETSVLKTIGLINVLGEVGNLTADSELIGLAVFDQPDPPGIGAILKGLIDKSVLVYRRFTSSYRVWEGSDIDIEARLEEGRARTSGEPLGRTLSRHLPARNLIARRHTHEVGCLRFFSTAYLDSPVEPQDIDRSGADGVVACCLPDGPAQEEAFVQWARLLVGHESRHLIVVIPHELSGLRELAAELRALHWVRSNTPQLRDDRVARRELGDRENAVEQAISETIDSLLDPRPAPLGSRASWWYQGREESADNPCVIAQLLSRVMDELYSSSPRLHNELLNRRTLSSAAAKGRRNLIEAMMLHQAEEALGIRGFPPERAMYETVLAVTGLHRKMPDGRWRFSAPERAHSSNLYPAWAELERMVYSESPEPYTLDYIQGQLSASPYGVMPGVFPVFLCAFMLAHWDQISLYREGAFLPEVSIADFEVLMKRPDYFALKGIRVRGQRAAFLGDLAALFKCEPTVVAVARSLVQSVRALPEHAWCTRRLPAEIIALRDVLERAASPEALLFTDLPGVFGQDPLKEDVVQGREGVQSLVKRLDEALKTWGAVFEDRMREAWNVFMMNCGLDPDAGLARLRELAQEVRGQSVPSVLAPVLKRIATESPESDSRVKEDILTLVAGRHPRSWADSDFERFAVVSKAFGDQLVQFMSTSATLGPEDVQQSLELMAAIKKRIPKGTPPRVVKRALFQLLKEIN